MIIKTKNRALNDLMKKLYPKFMLFFYKIFLTRERACLRIALHRVHKFKQLI